MGRHREAPNLWLFHPKPNAKWWGRKSMPSPIHHQTLAENKTRSWQTSPVLREAHIFLLFFSRGVRPWERRRSLSSSSAFKLVSPSLACIWFSRPWPSDQGLHCISVHADGDKLVLVYWCCCLFGWPCLLVWGSGERRNISLDHGGSQAAGGLRLPVTG